MTTFRRIRNIFGSKATLALSYVMLSGAPSLSRGEVEARRIHVNGDVKARCFDFVRPALAGLTTLSMTYVYLLWGNGIAKRTAPSGADNFCYSSCMIAVVDYGSGNLQSVLNACEAVGSEAVRTDKAEDLRKADGIILPGVGAFGDGMRNLKEKGLIEVLTEEVMGKKKPYLGICLGLQFLAERGLEHGEPVRPGHPGGHQGFGWIKGTVELMKPKSLDFKVPHMGWNSVKITKQSPLLEGLQESPVFYFVHSYHFVPDSSERNAVIGVAEYGMDVTAIVQKENLFGVQFHPEKSQAAGLMILKNFFNLVQSHA